MAAGGIVAVADGLSLGTDAVMASSLLGDGSHRWHRTLAQESVLQGVNRIEGITFLRSAAGEPAGVIASSEGNDVVSITSAPTLAISHPLVSYATRC